MSWFATSDLFNSRAPPQSGFALASGSRDTTLTIRLTQLSKRHPDGKYLSNRVTSWFSDHRIT